MKEVNGDRKDKKYPYTCVYSFQKEFKADSDNNISKKENLWFGQQRPARNPHLG